MSRFQLWSTYQNYFLGKKNNQRLFTFPHVVWRVALRHDAGRVNFLVFPSKTTPAPEEAAGAAAFAGRSFVSYILNSLRPLHKRRCKPTEEGSFICHVYLSHIFWIPCDLFTNADASQQKKARHSMQVEAPSRRYLSSVPLTAVHLKQRPITLQTRLAT